MSFENFKFENTSDDANSTTEKVSNIFEKMAKRSCKFVKISRNKKIKWKNPWSDAEIKDLKKTVIDLGKRMKQHFCVKLLLCKGPGWLNALGRWI